MKNPLVLVVRRGAKRRFDSLQTKTSNLDVEVIWDRRVASRQRNEGDAVPERRAGERRRPNGGTWELSDFCVAVPPRQVK